MNMFDQTIGVEIEMNNITRRKAAMIASKLFGTNKSADTSSVNGYRAWSAWDSQDREWKFVYDCSITSINDECKCELNTPILTYKDVPVLQDLIKALRKAGAKSNSNIGCGVHIHIGAKDHTATSLRNLTNFMASHEDLIIKSLGIAESRTGRWCQKVNSDFLSRINAEKPATRDEMMTVWYNTHGFYNIKNALKDHYNTSRYHMLNFHSTFTKGTVEFRLFQFNNPDGNRLNGLDANRIKAYIQFCLAISHKAKTLKDSRYTVGSVQTENPKFAMRTWMNYLGMIGDEFSVARDVFTEKLTGNATFRYKVA